MTAATAWAPGDPVFPRERERYVCADPECATTWSADVLICPTCDGPAKGFDDEPIRRDIGVDTAVDKTGAQLDSARRRPAETRRPPWDTWVDNAADARRP